MQYKFAHDAKEGKTIDYRQDRSLNTNVINFPQLL